MTDEQKEAAQWLLGASGIDAYSHSDDAKHRATILAMLSEPRLPAEPSADALAAMVKLLERSMYSGAPKAAYEVHRALHRHYTAPRTKTVEVWRVEFACKVDADANEAWLPVTRTFMNERSARDAAGDFSGRYACIKVTGPHQQEIPDDAR